MAKRALLLVVLTSGLVAAGPAATAPRSHSIDTFAYSVDLTRFSTVPPPPTPPTYAVGKFWGRLVIVRGQPRATLTWSLNLRRYGGRKGPDVSAHVHKGVVGERGPAVIQLCFACKSARVVDCRSRHHLPG